MLPAPVVFLFVVLTGPLTSYPVHKELYVTTDQAACKAQAAEWNAAILPNKPQYYCLTHRQGVLREDNGQGFVK